MTAIGSRSGHISWSFNLSYYQRVLQRLLAQVRKLLHRPCHRRVHRQQILNGSDMSCNEPTRTLMVRRVKIWNAIWSPSFEKCSKVATVAQCDLPCSPYGQFFVVRLVRPSTCGRKHLPQRSSPFLRSRVGRKVRRDFSVATGREESMRNWLCPDLLSIRITWRRSLPWCCR